MNLKKILGMTVLGIVLGLSGCKKIDKNSTCDFTERYYLDTKLYDATVFTKTIGKGLYGDQRERIRTILALRKPEAKSDFWGIIWPDTLRAIDYDLDGKFDEVCANQSSGPCNDNFLERVVKDFEFLYRREYGPVCDGTIRIPEAHEYIGEK